MESRRAILAYINAADEDEALESRVRCAGRPPPPMLPCEAAEVRELVAQRLRAER
jgi:hypothetical protein